jgi:hypothetical protein
MWHFNHSRVIILPLVYFWFCRSSATRVEPNSNLIIKDEVKQNRTRTVFPKMKSNRTRTSKPGSIRSLFATNWYCNVEVSDANGNCCINFTDESFSSESRESCFTRLNYVFIWDVLQFDMEKAGTLSEDYRKVILC